MREVDRGEKLTPQVLETVDLPQYFFGPKIPGKVKDMWVLQDGRRITVMTDRQLAFDRQVCLVPGKGQQLNMLSAFWFKKTADIIPNHMLDLPHPNVMICKDCDPFPIEMVATRSVSNVVLAPIKASGGRYEQPISHEEAGLKIGKKAYQKMEEASIALFERAWLVYGEAGLILRSTKFEFGQDRKGELTLIDELLTPDNSRLWVETNEKLDTEFLDLWLSKERGFKGKGEVPRVSRIINDKLVALYLEPLKRLTGRDLQVSTISPQAVRTAIVGYFK